MESMVSSLLNEEIRRMNLIEEKDILERESRNPFEEVNLARKFSRSNTNSQSNN